MRHGTQLNATMSLHTRFVMRSGSTHHTGNSTAAFLRQRNPPARCKTNVEQRPLMCLDRSILGCNGKGTHREIPKPAQVNSIRQARRRLMRWRLWASYFLLPFHRGAFCWRCPICLECLYHTEHSVFHVTHSFSWHLLKTTKSSDESVGVPLSLVTLTGTSVG